MTGRQQIGCTKFSSLYFVAVAGNGAYCSAYRDGLLRSVFAPVPIKKV